MGQRNCSQRRSESLEALLEGLFMIYTSECLRITAVCIGFHGICFRRLRAVLKDNSSMLTNSSQAMNFEEILNEKEEGGRFHPFLALLA